MPSDASGKKGSVTARACQTKGSPAFQEWSQVSIDPANVMELWAEYTSLPVKLNAQGLSVPDKELNELNEIWITEWYLLLTHSMHFYLVLNIGHNSLFTGSSTTKLYH